MDRRIFLKKGTAAVAGCMVSNKVVEPLAKANDSAGRLPPVPRRPLGKTGIELSIVGFGGVAVRGTEQSFANNIVAEAYDRGINYFDVAPTYGNAQERLGPALAPYRNRSFLACKSGNRTKSGAAKELEESLRQLRTDHIDLYQFHALTTIDEVNAVFGPDGAMEAYQAARKAGKVRLIGFSAHSVEAAYACLDRYEFDTILFPINFVLYSQGNFGPQVVERARQKRVGILALKAMAKTKWPKAMKESERPNPQCWYQPAAFPDEATLGLRWTLSQPITAALPPGDEKYFRLAMDVAQTFEPIQLDEEKTLMVHASGIAPIFPR